MGLGEFTNSGSENSHFGSHPADDMLNEWLDEFQERFPEPVDVEFVEVSTKMTKTHGRAFYDRDSGEKYIRIAEFVLYEYEERYQRQVLLHEMVHIWFYQNNIDHTDTSKLFNWVLGRVGADHGNTAPGNEDYEVIEKFLDLQ